MRQHRGDRQAETEMGPVLGAVKRAKDFGKFFRRDCETHILFVIAFRYLKRQFYFREDLMSSR